MIAAAVASHNACRSSSVESGDMLDQKLGWESRRFVGHPSGRPAQKIGQDANADILALLDVELRAGAIAGATMATTGPP